MQENLEHLPKKKQHKKTSQLQNASTQTWKIKMREMKQKKKKKMLLLFCCWEQEEGRKMKKKKKIIVSGLVLMSYKIASRAGKQQQMEALDQRGL